MLDALRRFRTKIGPLAAIVVAATMMSPISAHALVARGNLFDPITTNDLADGPTLVCDRFNCLFTGRFLFEEADLGQRFHFRFNLEVSPDFVRNGRPVEFLIFDGALRRDGAKPGQNFRIGDPSGLKSGESIAFGFDYIPAGRPGSENGNRLPTTSEFHTVKVNRVPVPPAIALAALTIVLLGMGGTTRSRRRSSSA